MDALILSLSSENLTLANAGGKGLNLGRLARAGFDVPGGFIITTLAYERFTAPLRAYILQRTAGLVPEDLPALEAAATEIRNWFHATPMPADIAAAIRAAYANLDQRRISNVSRQAVAVRSSATAEDLPEMSFAGQQDTYLNIVGEDAVLDAVVNCWASLWTARAIGYRNRNKLSQAELSLAVVVQALIESEVSGVMFTANPLTGLRSEIVIDATYGLGEALVSGQVEPDHYVVKQITTAHTESTAKRKIKSSVTPLLSLVGKTLGAKALAIHRKQGGGVEKHETASSELQALTDEQIIALAKIGAQIAEEYKSPQDIEWALNGNRFHVLQARPITSLYPLPEGLPAEPLQVLFSFGAGQGMLDPITPLGRDGIRAFVLSVGGRMGYKLTIDTQQAMLVAGERIYINITNLVRSPLGRKAVPKIMSALEPGSLGSLSMLENEPRLAPSGRAPMGLNTFLHVGRFLLPILGRFPITLYNPDAARERAFCLTEETYQRYAAQAMATQTFKQRLAFIRSALFEIPAFAFLNLIPVFAPGYMMFAMLGELIKELPDAERLLLEVTRGLPYNVTTEMDLALWQTARAIKGDLTAVEHFNGHTALELATDYLSQRLPEAAQQAVQTFLDQYGMRAIAEIDSGRMRWREDPTPVMQSLLSYMQIEDMERTPDVVFERSARQAEAAIETLIKELRNLRHGWFKARIGRAITRRVRALAGMREFPKLFIVRMMWLVRQALLQTGQSLVEVGVCEHADDVYFLQYDELDELEKFETSDGHWNATDDLKALFQRTRVRRHAYDREKLRRQSPRVLMSDGRAFYGQAGLDDVDGDAFSGSPVSPGVVEGVVHIVLDPHNTRLIPGEILVCPGTDPAWTPLFLSAGGLIMEVGGLMTHGAVVAREYGIPAVVGVHQVTRKLKNGQRVRVDGNTGKITLL